LRSRVLGAPLISSDAFAAYPEAIRYTFGRYVQYGQIIKEIARGDRLPDTIRYSQGPVVTIHRRVVTGSVDPKQLCTSHVERQNLNLRMASRRFTRLTNGFSKKGEQHAAAVSLYVAHYDFCRVHETTRTTPAVILGVSHRAWAISELVEAALAEYPQPPGRPAGRFRVIQGGRTS
jgi:hypothetical protein